MPRVPKSRFVNRVALRKAIGGFDAKKLREIYEPVYWEYAKKIRRKAYLQAPKKTGTLARGIKVRSFRREGARSGTIGKWVVYSRSVQDMVNYHGVPNRVLDLRDAGIRSRTIRGKKHKLKTGFNYSKSAQTTKKGNISKRKPLDKNGKPWAFGERKANRFMTDNQNFYGMTKEMSKKISRGIIQDIIKSFNSNVAVSR